MLFAALAPIAFDEERLARHAVERLSAETLGAAYRRASDSGISEPGILVDADRAPVAREDPP